MHHKQFKHTVPDIAGATGLKESKVRYDIRSGKLDPNNLKQLTAYVGCKMLEENASGR